MILFLFILVFNQLSSLFLRRRHATKISFRAMIFLLFILTVFLYAFYLGLEGVLMRLSGDETNFSLSEIIFNTFISARGTALLVSWNEFLSYPLFGKGYSNNLNYIPTFGEYWNSHNMILEQLCATGIIGTFPIFYLLFQCLRAWYKSISRLNERDFLQLSDYLLHFHYFFLWQNYRTKY